VSGSASNPGGTGEQRRLRTDVLLMLATKVVVLMLGVVTSVALARALGPSARGTLAAAFSLALVLVQLGTLGLTSSNPYFVARDPGDVRRIVGNSVWFAMGVGVLLIGVGSAVKGLLPGLVPGVGWAPMLAALLGIPGALATLFLQSVLLGLGRTVAYNAVDLVFSFVGTAATLVVLLVLDGGVTAVLAVIAARYALETSVYLWLLLRGVRPAWRPDMVLVRRMFGYAFRVYVATLLSFLVIRLDVLFVNGYKGASQAGLYAVAVSIADGMYIVPTVIGVNLFARVARGADTEVTASVFRSVALVYAGLCIVMAPLAGTVIETLFGARFDGATSLFLWLLPGIFSLGMLTILSNHFAGRGFPLNAMLVWFAGVAVNVAINIVFLPRSGTYIASLASSIAYTPRSGLDPGKRLRRCASPWQRVLGDRVQISVACAEVGYPRAPWGPRLRSSSTGKPVLAARTTEGLSRGRVPTTTRSRRPGTASSRSSAISPNSRSGEARGSSRSASGLARTLSTSPGMERG
jgi:O-antigen/teichoic acid export membrane protein